VCYSKKTNPSRFIPKNDTTHARRVRQTFRPASLVPLEGDRGLNSETRSRWSSTCLCKQRSRLRFFSSCTEHLSVASHNSAWTVHVDRDTPALHIRNRAVLSQDRHNNKKQSTEAQPRKPRREPTTWGHSKMPPLSSAKTFRARIETFQTVQTCVWKLTAS
jgi:hypothetical protein